jgi:polyferredoxin
LVALKSWLANGIFDSIHPAGLVIFLAAISLSLVLKRVFCSWICPFGTLSEGLALLGQKLFKRNFTPPRWLDYFLLSFKYVILAFFIIFIFVLMDGASAYAFLQTPYNMIADVKMLEFFKEIGGVGLTVLAVLIALSMLIQNFWCRYLCPYGALLGLWSMLSPWKIRRRADTCISCKKCTLACPNRIRVDEANAVWSPECSGCLECVEQCPVHNTLIMNLPKYSLNLSQKNLALAIISFWVLVVGIARLTGYWETSISVDMYKMLIPMAAQF